jgi:hypothetical protein
MRDRFVPQTIRYAVPRKFLKIKNKTKRTNTHIKIIVMTSTIVKALFFIRPVIFVLPQKLFSDDSKNHYKKNFARFLDISAAQISISKADFQLILAGNSVKNAKITIPKHLRGFHLQKIKPVK